MRQQLEGALQLVQAHHSLKRGLWLLFLASVLAGCATRSSLPPGPSPEYPGGTRPEPPVQSTPSPYGYREDKGGFAKSAEEVSGAAVINLLNQARGDMAAGRTDKAVASLETALQIEKRNPFVWQQLAVANLYRNQLEDAEIVAQRSNSFARGNPYVEIQNWRTIAAARRGRGDKAGAEQAQEKVRELQDQIGD